MAEVDGRTVHVAANGLNVGRHSEHNSNVECCVSRACKARHTAPRIGAGIMAQTTNAFIVLAIAGVAFIEGPTGFVEDPATVGGPPEDKKESNKPAMTQQQMMAQAAAGEAHKPLELLVGDWDGEVKMWFAPSRPPMTFNESVKRESIF